MPALFRIDVSLAEDQVLLALHGELDLVSSPALGEELREHGDRALIVVDLRELDFMDSTGLGVLVSGHQRLRAEGRRLALVAGTGQVSRLLALTGLHDQFDVISDPAEIAGPGISSER